MSAPPEPVETLDQPEPAWDVALLFPPQGQWSEEEYLALETNRLVEFSQGIIEVHEMPTQLHQAIMFLLARLLYEFVTAHGLGTVSIAGLRVRLWPGKFREPDVVFMAKEHDARRGDDYWDGADLAMEVVSSNRELDILHKRREYARAGVPEYWIIDIAQETISVLGLEGDRYRVNGVYRRGEVANSVILPGFSVMVDAVFTQSH